MEFNDSQPIYIQIMNQIKEDIIKGMIKPGDKILSVRDLSKDYKVNPNTISRAYQELEREGLLYRERGMGTFLTENKYIVEDLSKDRINNILDKFIEDIRVFNYSNEDILNLIEIRLESE